MDIKSYCQEEDVPVPEIDIGIIFLNKGSGSHPEPCESGCLFEWYNWLSGRSYTDACPDDVSRELHATGMAINDVLPDDWRQVLKTYLPDRSGWSPLSGTRDDGKDEARRFAVDDWLIRDVTPVHLQKAGKSEAANVLRRLNRIDDSKDLVNAGEAVKTAMRLCRDIPTPDTDSGWMAASWLLSASWHAVCEMLRPADTVHGVAYAARKATTEDRTSLWEALIKMYEKIVTV